MNRVLFALALVLIAASAANAQAPQAPNLASVDEPTPLHSVTEVPVAPAGITAVSVLTVEQQEGVAEMTARREVSARNLLAIVGGVVVVVALIALFS